VAQVTLKELLQHVAERYETLFFQNVALHAVLTARSDAALLRSYMAALSDEGSKQIVREKFAPLYATIAAFTDETNPGELLSQIPAAPKVQ
jgi:hypothetical protein